MQARKASDGETSGERALLVSNAQGIASKTSGILAVPSIILPTVFTGPLTATDNVNATADVATTPLAANLASCSICQAASSAADCMFSKTGWAAWDTVDKTPPAVVTKPTHGFLLGWGAGGAYQNKCNSEGDIDVLKVDGF
jgi:hypothetical protein